MNTRSPGRRKENSIKQKLTNQGFKIDKQFLVEKEDQSVYLPYIKASNGDFDVIIELDNLDTFPLENEEELYRIEKIEPDTAIDKIIDKDIDGVALECEGGVCVKTREKTDIIGNVDKVNDLVPVVKLSKLLSEPDELKQKVKTNNINLKLIELNNSQSNLNVIESNLSNLLSVFNRVNAKEHMFAESLIYYTNYLLNAKEKFSIEKTTKTITPNEENTMKLVTSGIDRKKEIINTLLSKLKKIEVINKMIYDITADLLDLEKYIDTEMPNVGMI